MAREINAERREGFGGGDGHAPGARAHGSPEEAHEAIDESRQQISRDLDTIEDRVEEKKEELIGRKEQLKRKTGIPAARRRVRSNPLPSVGAALGAGLLVGFIQSRLGEREERQQREHEAMEKRRAEERAREERRRERSLVGRLGRLGRTLTRSPVGRQITGTTGAALATGLKNRVSRAIRRRRGRMAADGGEWEARWHAD